MLYTGDADGLGETRKRELAKSGITLGLRKEDDVFVVDSPDFRDGMNETWSPDKISSLLCSAFAPGLARARSAPDADSTPVAASIDVLVTFDAGGVSSHPNHISLYHGARSFVAALVAGKPGWKPPVDLYTLTSVSFIRKYTGILDVFATLGSWAFWSGVMRSGGDKSRPRSMVFLNTLVPGGGSATTAWRAMISAHKSQMVWFRYGWITLSRYMYMNDLVLEKIKGR